MPILHLRTVGLVVGIDGLEGSVILTCCVREEFHNRLLQVSALRPKLNRGNEAGMNLRSDASGAEEKVWMYFFFLQAVHKRRRRAKSTRWIFLVEHSCNIKSASIET